MGPVVVKAGTAFRNEVEAGKHRPTPYDFLSAGLGGCTSMTMRVVAKRENIPLEGAEITITNDRMYAKDCADCTSSTGYIHRFDVRIKLIGNLTEAQRERLLSVARRCPVAKTLTSEIKIEEQLV
ncbi:MAG: osmotically inducible protein C [Acidobacteria bacterium]|nr:MAG: osmotically inducible protein C [Acidobacteriota bacterium]